MSRNQYKQRAGVWVGTSVWASGASAAPGGRRPGVGWAQPPRRGRPVEGPSRPMSCPSGSSRQSHPWSFALSPTPRLPFSWSPSAQGRSEHPERHGHVVWNHWLPQAHRRLVTKPWRGLPCPARSELTSLSSCGVGGHVQTVAADKAVCTLTSQSGNSGCNIGLALEALVTISQCLLENQSIAFKSDINDASERGLLGHPGWWPLLWRVPSLADPKRVFHRPSLGNMGCSTHQWRKGLWTLASTSMSTGPAGDARGSWTNKVTPVNCGLFNLFFMDHLRITAGQC